MLPALRPFAPPSVLPDISPSRGGDQPTALSKDLRKRGFTFVGPTTMYAHMQAMGMVNDHIEGCFCRAEVEAACEAFKRPV